MSTEQLKTPDQEAAFKSMEQFMSVMSQALKIMSEGKPTTKVHMQFKCLDKEVTLEFRISTPAEIENHSDGSSMIVTDPNLPKEFQEALDKAEAGVADVAKEVAL